jgi:hypothetical protein
MSIQSYVSELESIKIELKSLNEKRKKLKFREHELEHNIADFLKSKDQIGVKYQGSKILLEQKEKRVNKKNKDKDNDAINILTNYGLSEPQKVLNEILEARKGEKVQTDKLKIQKIKL